MNLLIILSDEHRRDALGCMAHPLVKTPHLLGWTPTFNHTRAPDPG